MTIHVDQVVDGPGTKSDKIRALSAAGMSRADIARALGIRYQHVRNVLVGDEQAGRAVADGPVAASRGPQARSDAAASTDGSSAGPVKLRVGPNGEVVLPVPVLEALGLRPGMALAARIENGELRLYTIAEAVRRAQDLMRSVVPAGVSLVDELIAERREEARREWADDEA